MNKDGVKVYTTTVVVEEQEFAESRAENATNRGVYHQSAPNQDVSTATNDTGDGFMSIPDGIDEELPFH